MSGLNDRREVDAVIALMESEPLNPAFLWPNDPSDTPYENAARIGIRNPEWERSDGRSVPEWIDGDPIYPDHPDARRFSGNFVNLSRAFEIDTDDAAIIGRLRAAIADNMKRFADGAA